MFSGETQPRRLLHKANRQRVYPLDKFAETLEQLAEL
jgi:hypothetical protein